MQNIINVYGPGLVAAGVTEIYIEKNTLKFSISPVDGYEKVRLPKFETPEEQSATYMFTDTPYPVFADIRLRKKNVSRILSGLIRVTGKVDPVLHDELKFVDEDFWREAYNSLKQVCVSCCPNGHALSFQTICGFMTDDGWDCGEISNIIKVKCPVCRKRYPIHESIVLLSRFFVSLVDDENGEPELKDDKIQTYFSTEDDEEDTTEIDNLRRIFERDDNDGDGEEEAEEEAESDIPDEDSDETYVDEGEDGGEEERDLQLFEESTVKEPAENELFENNEDLQRLPPDHEHH